MEMRDYQKPSKLDDWKTYVVIVFIMLLFGVWILPTLKNEVADHTEPEPEWCLVADLPPSGGDWSQGSAGAYEYQVIATQSGFKVFQRCSKIE